MLKSALICLVFQGSTDASVFEDFIEQILQHCVKWPEPKTLLVLDNASFHYSDRIEQKKHSVKSIIIGRFLPMDLSAESIGAPAATRAGRSSDIHDMLHI